MIAVYAMNTAYAIVFNDSKVSNNITMINQSWVSSFGYKWSYFPPFQSTY